MVRIGLFYVNIYKVYLGLGQTLSLKVQNNVAENPEDQQYLKPGANM
jgi:hypothetical protein